MDNDDDETLDQANRRNMNEPSLSRDVEELEARQSRGMLAATRARAITAGSANPRGACSQDRKSSVRRRTEAAEAGSVSCAAGGQRPAARARARDGTGDECPRDGCEPPFVAPLGDRACA